MRAILALVLLASPVLAAEEHEEGAPPHRRSLRELREQEREAAAERRFAPPQRQPPQPVTASAQASGGGAQPSPDLSSSGLSPQSQAILQEMISALQKGQKADPMYYFGRILALEPHKFPEVIALMTRLSGSVYGPGLGSDLWFYYVRLNPKNPAGYAGLGGSLFQQARYGPAVRAYTQAISLGAATPKNYYGRGFAADQLGDHELAHQDAGKVLESDPNDKAAYSLYMLTNNLASSVHVDPATGEAVPWDNPVSADEAPSRSGAVEVKGRYAGPPPESDPARLSLEMTQVAARFLQLGDWHSAMSAAARAVQLDPNNAQAHNYLSMALERLGEHDKAVASATTALSLAPQSVPALNTRAWALSGMGKFDAALADSERALALNPNDGYGFLNKARAQGGLGRREEMLDSLRRAADIDPKLARLYEDATTLPRDRDTDLLFTGMFEPKGAAPSVAPAARPAQRRQGLLLVSGLMMLGGFLVVFGLLHAMSARVRESLAVPVRRLRAQGGPEKPASRSDAGLANYELRRVLGTDGGGVTYEAQDKALKRAVCLRKMLGDVRDDPRERERFLKDARLAAGLRHPNIVETHGVLEDGADIYLVFDPAEGKTLKELLASQGALPWKEALEIFRGVCSAVDYAHSKNIIHRDLKPSNILLDSELQPRVRGFALAKSAKKALVVRASEAGGDPEAPQYLAPEAEEGTARRASDLYSLGVILYEIMTGRPPFKGGAGPLYADKVSGKFDPPSKAAQLPKGLDAVVARALAPEPDDRFTSAKELLGALEALC